MIGNDTSEGSEKTGREKGANEEDELELLGSISQSCKPNAPYKSHKEIKTIDETGEASGMGVRVVQRLLSPPLMQKKAKRRRMNLQVKEMPSC